MMENTTIGEFKNNWGTELALPFISLTSIHCGLKNLIISFKTGLKKLIRKWHTQMPV